MGNTDAKGFFDDANREGSPSALLKQKGHVVKGQILDMYKIDYVPFNKKEVEKDRNGDNVKQLVIVLQTEHRDFDSVAKHPVDAEGKKLPADKDTGRRAVYARPGTNIYSAIGKAVVAAGAKDPLIGGKLAVQLYDQEDTGKGNPLNKFRAKYEAPAVTVDDEWSTGDEEAEADTSTEVVDEPAF